MFKTKTTGNKVLCVYVIGLLALFGLLVISGIVSIACMGNPAIVKTCSTFGPNLLGVTLTWAILGGVISFFANA
jgi:hypothetical protein